MFLFFFFFQVGLRRRRQCDRADNIAVFFLFLFLHLFYFFFFVILSFQANGLPSGSAGFDPHFFLLFLMIDLLAGSKEYIRTAEDRHLLLVPAPCVSYPCHVFSEAFTQRGKLSRSCRGKRIFNPTLLAKIANNCKDPLVQHTIYISLKLRVDIRILHRPYPIPK